MERRQVPCYVGAIVAGALCGLAAPGVGGALEVLVAPVLGALLYATFLQVPIAELGRSLRAGRFLLAVLVVNFVVVPLVVAAMFPLMPGNPALRLGILLVLLAPCVDYVIVFSRLAGGSADRLLAATPLLLLAQMALLPPLLALFLGPELAEVIEPEPLVRAFLGLILLPLLLAWLTQAAARRFRAGRLVADGTGAAMVPLMAATLLTVVASQVPKLDGRLGEVVPAVPFFVVFLAVMAPAGRAVARGFRLPTAEGRAVVFTGATRNGLVLLPLALALPDERGALAPVVMVTQTLVEVVGMVVFVRLVPRLLPAGRKLPGPPTGAGGREGPADTGR
ncbi:bile acid:sodium symporter [Streptomyces sp. ST2-7A]|uniref:bile acid:sodium symporter n=1 Tax=Streptomyces sp. ST2-7A TaxID=2907214 RepID=UPI001F239EC5|nr:bile acid:sodium symporter [Streptomyces sp. ST2-7A]MCE7082270.1 bile acid:sodium symporter [Streptomyces sp. ST2-7A]